MLAAILPEMIDVLSALSLYRQLEALELTLTSQKDVTGQWMTAYTNQNSFNHILSQITSQCEDAPQFLASFSHIEPADIPKGGNRAVYPRFLAKVQMLKQAVGALVELSASSEQQRQMGFKP